MNGEQAYQNAMKRRAELRQELDEIETFLRLYEKFAGVGEVAAHNTVVESRAQRETVSGMKLIPHIRNAILDSGRPLPRSGIVRALSDQGIKVGGQDPAQNIATLMSRAKREFVNLKPHGYWPRDVAYTPANYEPNQPGNGEPADSSDEDHKGNGGTAASAGPSADLWAS